MIGMRLRYQKPVRCVVSGPSEQQHVSITATWTVKTYLTPQMRCGFDSYYEAPLTFDYQKCSAGFYLSHPLLIGLPFVNINCIVLKRTLAHILDRSKLAALDDLLPISIADRANALAHRAPVLAAMRKLLDLHR